MVMSLVRQQYRDISPVTLQVVGGAVSSSLYCGEVEGLSGGLVESFLVEFYRCKLCQFTCGLKASISSHLLHRHRPPTLAYLGGANRAARPEDREEAGLQRGASAYQLDLNGESKQSDEDEDEDFLLYNMLDNMSPPTCDISSEGGLQVAHTCEVTHLTRTYSHTHTHTDSHFKSEAITFVIVIKPGLDVPGFRRQTGVTRSGGQRALSSLQMTIFFLSVT